MRFSLAPSSGPHRELSLILFAAGCAGGVEWTADSPRRRPQRGEPEPEPEEGSEEDYDYPEPVSNQWIRGSRHSLGYKPHEIAQMQQDQRWLDEQLRARKTERQEAEAQKKVHRHDPFGVAGRRISFIAATIISETWLRSFSFGGSGTCSSIR